MSSILQSDYLKDPIAIGAFHAEQMGIMVACSGGNEGPQSFTVINAAPWIFTIAASNIDRDFQSAVVLGNGRTFQVRDIIYFVPFTYKNWFHQFQCSCADRGLPSNSQTSLGQRLILLHMERALLQIPA